MTNREQGSRGARGWGRGDKEARGQGDRGRECGSEGQRREQGVMGDGKRGWRSTPRTTPQSAPSAGQ